MKKTFLELCEEFKNLSDKELQVIMDNNRSQIVWEAAYITHLVREETGNTKNLKRNRRSDV